MIHQFYRYDISLENYQYREIPQAIVPYEKRFERSLSTEIKRFQKELNWTEMWTIPEVYSRLENRYHFWVLRPKNQIKGWIWLAPDGEIKNAYVSKWLRNQGWYKHLTYQALNKALDLDRDTVYLRIDIWNEPSKRSIEQMLERISCKSKISKIEESYE